MMLLILGMIVGVASCGGGGSQQIQHQVSGTPAGTFNVTVSAASGTTTHTSMITLTVQ
jgi:hypothetical protein